MEWDLGANKDHAQSRGRCYELINEQRSNTDSVHPLMCSSGQARITTESSMIPQGFLTKPLCVSLHGQSWNQR
jgi:hypothetical protein